MASRYNMPHNDFCRSCRDEEEVESVKHFLCECPALQRTRHRFLGANFFEDLDDANNISLKDLTRFIRRAGWFNIS